MHAQPAGPSAQPQPGSGTPEWPRRGRPERHDSERPGQERPDHERPGHERHGGGRQGAEGPGGGRPGQRRVARPLPDPVAIRIAPIPATAPPYDDLAAGHADGGRGAGEPSRERGHGAGEPSGERGRGAGEPSREGRLATTSRRRPGAGRAPGGGAGTGPGRRVAVSGRSGQEQPGVLERRGVPGQRGGPGRPDGRGGPGRAGGGEWPSRFAQVLTETLAGSRPPAQITPWTTERARSNIRKLGPLLMAGQRPVIRRVVTSRPAPGVVEMSVVVGVADRVSALAIRLELQGARRAAPGRPGRQARWVCTTVQAA